MRKIAAAEGDAALGVAGGVKNLDFYGVSPEGDPLEGRTPYEREGQRRYAIGAAFFRAYQMLVGVPPPIYMARTFKPVSRAMRPPASISAARAST